MNMNNELGLTVTFENGDTSEQFEMTFKIDKPEVISATSSQLLKLIEAPNYLDFETFYKSNMTKGGVLYDELLPRFRKVAYEKLDWEDVMVFAPKFSLNDVPVKIDFDTDEGESFRQSLGIQLVRDIDPSNDDESMYFFS